MSDTDATPTDAVEQLRARLDDANEEKNDRFLSGEDEKATHLGGMEAGLIYAIDVVERCSSEPDA